MSFHKKRLSISTATGLVVETVNKIVPLAMMRMAHERLGVGGLGYALFGLAVIELALPFVLWGYHHYAILHARGLPPSKLGVFIGSLYQIRFLHSVIVCGILAALFWWLPFYRPYFSLVMALSFLLFATALDTLWLHTLKQTLSISNGFIGFTRMLSLLLIWYVVKRPEDALWFAVLNLTSNALFNVLTCIYGVKHYQVQWIPWRQLPKLFSQGAPFAAITLGLGLCERLDMILAERLFSIESATLYLGPARICHGFMQLGQVIVVSFYSEMLIQVSADSLRKHFEMGLKLLLSAFLPLLWGSLFTDKALIQLILGSSFQTIPLLLSTLILSTLLSLLISAYGLQILLNRGAVKPFTHALGLGLGVGLITMVLGGTYGGPLGLGLGMCAGKLLTLYECHRHARAVIPSIPIKNFFSILVPSLIMSLALWLIQPHSLWAALAWGGGVYLCAFGCFNPWAVAWLRACFTKRL